MFEQFYTQSSVGLVRLTCLAVLLWRTESVKTFLKEIKCDPAIIVQVCGRCDSQQNFIHACKLPKSCKDFDWLCLLCA